MASAYWVDGVLQQTNAQSESIKKSQSSTGDSLGKDAFLQLLVAQMKYQDPLEPTSNTEYISQFATFAELEEMQNLRTSSDLQRASSLVGQQVIIKMTSATGRPEYVTGRVDYVVYENGKALLGIKGGEYPLDNVEHVVDSEYLDALEKAGAILAAVGKLPTVILVGKEHLDAIKAIRDVYEDLSDYEKSFITPEEKELLQKYFDKMDELNARTIIKSIEDNIENLPAVDEISSEDFEVIESIKEAYEGLSEYQLKFVSDERKKVIQGYIDKMEELKAAEAEES